MKFFPWGLPRRILSYEKIVKGERKAARETKFFPAGFFGWPPVLGEAEGKPENSFPEVPGEVFRRGR